MLTLQELNRALLARQGLLERARWAPLDLVDHLVGVQAQVPDHPYQSLWARIEGFDPASLSALVASGEAVRGGVMRATVHLLRARDFVAIDPLTRPVLRKVFATNHDQLNGAPVERVLADARALLQERPLTRKQLSDALAPRFPAADPMALGYAALLQLPVVQIPPRGEWGRTLQPTWALLEEPGAATTVDELVLRYLRAFGPSTPGDARAWSRLGGMREVFERLRPQLRVYEDERGRELFDVPDGVFADPGTPAPPRLLPQFDNVLLGHDDRSRIGLERLQDLRARVGHVLLDGFWAGTWRIEGGVMTLDVPRRDDLEAEAAALMEFLGEEPRVAFAG
jgi:hypothetical protein